MNQNPIPFGQPNPGTPGDAQHCVQCFRVVSLADRPRWDRYGYYHPTCWDRAERTTAAADGRLSI